MRVRSAFTVSKSKFPNCNSARRALTVHAEIRNRFRSDGDVIDRGFHRVSSHHQLYYEVHGNPNGPAAVVLHGGPGAGCSPSLGKLFDLGHWKVVLFDQRGCGKSIPRGLLHSNNPKKIIGDMEKLRHHLEITKWMVFGGSYGTTLALCYAQLYPSRYFICILFSNYLYHRVSGMVLRAICLMRQQELDWLFAPTGIATQLPKAYERFLSILQPNEQREPIKAYYNRMLSLNELIRTQAARYWREWTMMATFSNLPQILHTKVRVRPDDLFAATVNLTRNLNLFNNRSINNVVEEVKPLPGSIIQSLIEAHFFYNNDKFIKKTFPILNQTRRLSLIPSIAIHGDADPLCQKSNALDLKRAWKELDLRIIPNGGHSQFDPLIKEATIKAIDEIKLKIVIEEEDEFHDEPPTPTYPIPEPQYRKKYR
eukprot:g7155.t1